MDIYVKSVKKASISGTNHNAVYIKDIAEVIAPPEIAKRVKNLKLLTPETGKKKMYLVSITDIIRAIDAALPGHTVNSVGETDTLIDYAPEKSKDNPVWKWAKIVFIFAVMFTGSATALMSFHTDAQIPQIFKNFYYIFFNEKVDNPAILELPYSIGVAAGIIVFFNHFAGKKITSDPTPIEVELSVYESDVSDTVIDVLNSRKIGGSAGIKDIDDGGE